jgi:hypothetical protein
MSFSVQVTINDGATPFIQELKVDCQPSQELYQRIADQATALVQQKFRDNDDNYQSPFHTGFWGDMRAGTFAVATDEMATVRMPRPVAQRFFGGTITPVSGTYLTIPLRQEAAGRKITTFNDLRFIPAGNGSLLAVQKDGFKTVRGRKRKDGSRPEKQEAIGGLALYLLVASVTQRGNPDVLPDDYGFAAAAYRGISGFLKARHG